MSRPVDVILAIEATTKATRTIPIVGVDLESDPVAPVSR
jgi:hypothetical protein